MAFVNCDKIGQTLIDWLNLATQSQKDDLCEALGCTEDTLTQIASTDSDALTITGDGTAGSPLQVHVVLDPASDNLLSLSASGLKASLPPYSASDDNKVLTIDPSTHTPKWM